MKAFDDFKRLLSAEFCDDYWADVGVSEAEALLRQFSEAERKQLQAECKSMPLPSQVRCAEALGGARHPFAISLLMEMLRHSDSEIFWRAIEALDNIVERKDDPDSLAPAIQHQADVELLQFRAAVERRIALESLAGKLRARKRQ